MRKYSKKILFLIIGDIIIKSFGLYPCLDTSYYIIFIIILIEQTNSYYPFSSSNFLCLGI